MIAATSCGKKGAPLPPLPRTPPAVSDLEVTLAEDVLELAWSAAPPAESGAAQVEYLAAWEVGSGKASVDATAPLDVSEPPVEGGRTSGADLKEFLQRAPRAEGPAVEWGAQASRRQRRLRWSLQVGDVAGGEWVRVVLLARSGRREVASNDVSLQAPEQPLPRAPALTPTTDPEGVRLGWLPLPNAGRLELYRQERGEEERRLLARVDPGAGEFKDRSVRLGATYRFTARLRQKAGERAWVVGAVSDTEPVTYQDTFPPAAPRNLALVIEGEGARLLWSPNREPDLAGYRIYRRLGEAAAALVSTAHPWDVTWLDVEPEEGAAVVYWLTAFDSSPQANESQPSEQVSGIVRRPRALPVGTAEAPSGGARP